jgi:hypothetical protein
MTTDITSARLQDDRGIGAHGAGVQTLLQGIQETRRLADSKHTLDTTRAEIGIANCEFHYFPSFRQRSMESMID